MGSTSWNPAGNDLTCKVSALSVKSMRRDFTHVLKMPKMLFSFFVCLALAFSACRQHSSDTVPSGSFRLIVNDMVKDETFRFASLKVSSAEPGILSYDIQGSRGTCELLISGDKLREGRFSLVANRASDSRATNAFIQTGLQLNVEGGDGGMLVQGSAQARGGGGFYASKDAKLEDLVTMTATNGFYPLDKPLEIGRINGKALMLTVGTRKL